MQAAGRRRTSYAIAASALAHLAVFAVAFSQRPTLPIPPYAEAPEPGVIRVELVPRPAASARLAPLRAHRTPSPLPGAPAPLAVAPAPVAPPAGALTSAPVAPLRPDLRAALQHGLAGCSNLAAIGITPAEVDGCNERLGRGVASAPFLPAPIPGRIRAYYDQVALAKAPDPLMIRDISKGTGGAGAAGIFWADGVPTNGHGPGVGCKIHFGVGKPIPNAPPHALHWGPCYIEPPKGSLTPEVDITPP